ARPRCRGVAHQRYAWTWAGQCRRAGARQPETLHRAGARRSRGRAFRACLGGTSTSSSAVPGLAHTRNAWTWAGSVVEPVLDNRIPFIELVLDFPRERAQRLPGRDELQLVRGAGV